MVEYEPINEANQRCSSWRIGLLIGLYVVTSALVFITWNLAYKDLQFPPNAIEVPDWWVERANLYANGNYKYHYISHDFRLVRNQTTNTRLLNKELLDSQSVHVDVETLEPAKKEQPPNMRLVCYYSSTSNDDYYYVRLKSVRANLCTHINIGFGSLHNNSINLSNTTVQLLKEDVPYLRLKNPTLKILLSIGGADSGVEFALMVKNHENRKRFLQSLKHVLSKYTLDGVDLDWEFPSAYNKERQHFSQLLYEIKAEFRRERRDYLLTVAVAAPEGIAFFAYDVPEINKYADYVNLMTYDFHFYTKSTPFTGLNAPLYALSNEHSILATLNINHSVNFWLQNGLRREKLVVGLPTYGHSFTLVNPFNTEIGAPAQGFGRCGSKGFTSYSEICWFRNHNIAVSVNYIKESCSPYLSSGTEWISFENEESLTCKTRYIKTNSLGGVMVFSINTDDTKHFCDSHIRLNNNQLNGSFPLIDIIKRNLLN